MISVGDVDSLRRCIRDGRQQGRMIGLVPTMGCLHAGHRALISEARRLSGFIVVSIFVNPTQFGPSEDYEQYPRTIEADRDVCIAEGVDLLFCPAVEDIYRPDHSVMVEETRLSSGLCGQNRSGHFRGVTTIVAKLFNLVQPDVAIFGQKDAQQAAIVRRMARDLNFPIRIQVAPTVREPDGLALSSRNRHLDPESRSRAPVIYQALQEAVGAYRDGARDAGQVLKALAGRIESQPAFQVEYATAVDEDTFEPVAMLRQRVLLAVAVRVGAVRLIDNERLG